MSAPAVTIPFTEDHVLHSTHVGQDFHVRIGHPVPGWRGPSPEPVRVLYLLDADLYFGTAVEMTRLTHQLYGELPPILVVGIAYGTDDPRVQGELRNRDFTPTSDASFEELGKTMQPGWTPLLPEGRRMGRAAEFLAFLRAEVQPFVEERFGAAHERSILFGSSLGGLFSLWAFLTAPESFGAFIATSPAIWWDHERLFELEAALAQSRSDVDGRLVLAVGELEELAHIPMLARFKMVTNVRAMAERLAARNYRSLALTTQVLAGETHTSVVPAALLRGLRAICRPAPV